MKQMTIVAFLQCMWVLPDCLESVQRIYAKRNTPEQRAALNARFLFRKSLTGRRLRDAFGVELCDRIIWEETTKRIGTHSSFDPAPDRDHVAAVMEYFKPSLVLAFGKRAASAVEPCSATLYSGPHPAARTGSVMCALKSMASDVRRFEAMESMTTTVCISDYKRCWWNRGLR